MRPPATPSAITAQTDAAGASFRRLSPTDVSIKLSYLAPSQTVALDGNLQQGVKSLCESEIEFARKALMDVGEALASQLHDVGKQPTIHREWEDEDERTYHHRDNLLTVEASRYESEEALSHEQNVSEAGLVREVVAQMIAQRTQGIRSVYQAMLHERDGKAGQE